MTYQFHPTVLREYDIRGVIGETLGPDDARAIGRGFATLLRRQVDVVAVPVLAQVDRVDIAHRLAQGGRERRPVDQVGRMPDRQPRRRGERRKGHAVVVAVLEYRGIGMVTGTMGLR